MVKLFANSREPDQMPHSAASDLGLHCLPITLLGVYRLHWVKADNSGTCDIHAVYIAPDKKRYSHNIFSYFCKKAYYLVGTH